MTAIVFSDFECPYCRALARGLDRIWEESPQDLRVEFRHFPLCSDCNPGASNRQHPLACAAATAAEAANAQGKFWEYHGKLIALNQAPDEARLRQIATDVGVDLGRFDADRASRAAKAIEEDTRAGMALEIRAVPVLFVNGRRVDPRNEAELRAVLRRARAEAEGR